jgi:hypothetical protein
MKAMVQLITETQKEIMSQYLGIDPGKCCFPLPVHKYHSFQSITEMWKKLWGMRDYACTGGQSQQQLFEQIFMPWDTKYMDPCQLFDYLTHLKTPPPQITEDDVTVLVVIAGAYVIILYGAPAAINAALPVLGKGAIIHKFPEASKACELLKTGTG